MKGSLFALFLFAPSVHAWGYCNDDVADCVREPVIIFLCVFSLSCTQRDSPPPRTSSRCFFFSFLSSTQANWANAGECEKPHVKKMCPHSCSVCPHVCRDAEEACPAWADSGQCEDNLEYMYQNCPVSCGACKTKCFDKDAQCPSWARQGECKKNAGLLTECSVSCGVCTGLCLDKQ